MKPVVDPRACDPVESTAASAPRARVAVRSVLCLLSGLVLAVAYVALGAAPSAHAAESGVVLAPGNPPLTRDVSDATVAVTLFMLKQVASGDASESDLTVDQNLLDEWAGDMADEWGTFSPDEQAQLATMPALRGGLLAAWSQSSPTQRSEVRDAFRPVAEDWLSDTSCDTFTSLADAGFVEKTSSNVGRYLACQDDAESVEAAPDTTALPPSHEAPATAVASASAPSQPDSSPSVSPTAAGQRASEGLLASHNMYTSMSNVLLENHVGNMNAILNMGDSNYHYVYSNH
jgi:hypothetical protein